MVLKRIVPGPSRDHTRRRNSGLLGENDRKKLTPRPAERVSRGIYFVAKSQHIVE